MIEHPHQQNLVALAKFCGLASFTSITSLNCIQTTLHVQPCPECSLRSYHLSWLRHSKSLWRDALFVLLNWGEYISSLNTSDKAFFSMGDICTAPWDFGSINFNNKHFFIFYFSHFCFLTHHLNRVTIAILKVFIH